MNRKVAERFRLPNRSFAAESADVTIYGRLF